MYQKTEEQFRQDNRITSGDWEVAQIDWGVLAAIASHHETQKQSLLRAAEGVERELRSIESVHSVRSRVKDTDHLLKKIIRKRVEGNVKYVDITVDNYQDKVTDLVGVRALHLFKDDIYTIDEQIRKAWDLGEEAIAYVRSGDSGEALQSRFKVENHKDGYRSIHYIVSTSPRKQRTFVEVQVRTIFEEGWAEIDHKIKYPDFSQNKSVINFLSIFNRLAGAADEMGSFVRGLTQSLQEVESIVDHNELPLEKLTQALADASSAVPANSGAEESEVGDANLNLRKFESIKIENVRDAAMNVALDAARKIVLSNYSKNFYHRFESKKDPEIYPAFRIVDPSDKTLGDYVSFTIVDGSKAIGGRISCTALAVLRGGEAETDMETFQKHQERIRQAAFAERIRDPSLQLIALGSDNF